LHFKFKKGINLPLSGQPDQRIDNGSDISSVAVLGADYVGLKPTMLVQEGDRVKEGTPLFEDKKNPGVVITSPASGSIASINRGAKRVLLSVVIDIDGEESESFTATAAEDISGLSQDTVRESLLKSGLWASFRTRPYGKVPSVASTPSSIFVNAMDSNPLAPNPAVIINERATDFVTGISLLSKFNVPVYVCKAEDSQLPDLNTSNTTVASFSGPHPAGLPSTHIHMIDPVDANKTVWTIGYQDVIAIGSFFLNGRLDTSRYISLAGPYVNSPRILTTRLGADLTEFTAGRTLEGRLRVISGSVFNGHHATGQVNYLGRYHNQVSIIEENDDREFMGWIAPGTNKFSAINVFISSLFKPKSFNITSSQNGSPRAIVPIGVYEKVMPLDILPTPLLKAILVKDTDSAQELGCLELVEEDMSLCTFVDPGKHDFGPVLRTTLTQIEREG